MGIIPGFAIKNRYFDDLCDAQEGMRIVLQESASVVIDYVAVGGMGCSEVCANAAFAAASMNMPFLSYECNGRDSPIRLSTQALRVWVPRLPLWRCLRALW